MQARAAAKAQLARARESLALPAAAINPHLAPPEVQLLLQPASATLHGNAQAAAGQGAAGAGGAEPMAIDDGDATQHITGNIVWSAVDPVKADESGARARLRYVARACVWGGVWGGGGGVDIGHGRGGTWKGRALWICAWDAGRAASGSICCLLCLPW